VLLVGLTGGIGSGKSVVAKMLEARGAVVFDADLLARDAIAPGTPGHDAVVERFGPTVLAPGGDVDREALASVVFVDGVARRDLEAIVHPEVRRLFAEGARRTPARTRSSSSVPPARRDRDAHGVRRAHRGVHLGGDAGPSADARSGPLGGGDPRPHRGAAALEAKAEAADILIDNEGTLRELEGQVDRVWADLRERSSAKTG